MRALSYAVRPEACWKAVGRWSTLASNPTRGAVTRRATRLAPTALCGDRPPRIRRWEGRSVSVSQSSDAGWRSVDQAVPSPRYDQAGMARVGL